MVAPPLALRLGVAGAAALAVFIAMCAPCFAAGADASFHAPRTEQERALDAILKRADKDENLLDNLFEGRGTKRFKPSADYTTVLTAALLGALRAKERGLVARECKGKYVAGDICGLDYSPITCAQDSDTRYQYRTVEQGADSARIDYRWPSGKTAAATYRLLRQDGKWKIDAISCATGSTFNTD